MANIEDLINKYGKEIAAETAEYRNAVQAGVPRDSARRPWSAGQDAASESEAYAPASPYGPESSAWYASWSGLWQAIVRHRLPLFTTLFGSLMVLVALSQFVPSTYSSMLQLYAPEKTDSITSRLALFSNRIEFAGFPVDFKIPMGLVARRIKGEPAKNWVLKEYASRTHPSDAHLINSLVRAETFYAEGSELLVIQGYANEPQIAADVTNLYWDYLENEVNRMRRDHLERVDQWFVLTMKNLQTRLESVEQRLAKVTATPLTASRTQLNNKLVEGYADVELRRIKTQKQVEDLKQAIQSAQSGSLNQIWALSIPEIQDLRQVYAALPSMAAITSAEVIKTRRSGLEQSAIEAAQKLLQDKRVEYATLETEAKKFQAQIGPGQTTEATNEQRELMRQQTDLINQTDELNRLRAQIAVEFNIAPSRLRVIQPALPDPLTRRPLLLVKYSLCALLSLVLSVLALVWLQYKFVTGRAATTRSYTNVGAPQPTGAGA